MRDDRERPRISSIAVGHPRNMETVEYTRGRFADVYGDPAQRTVLMWHGTQTDARASMRPLADRLAEFGVGVIVTDWDSHAEDRGRGDLLQALRFARESSATSDGIALVGWSLGGVAAAGATLHASRLGLRLRHTVCLAGAFMVADPLSGGPLPADLTDCEDRAPFTLLHGVDDAVIPVAVSRDFAATLREQGWPVEVAELPADHGTIAGARYDAAVDRYSAAFDVGALAVTDDVATRIAAVT
jgi:dipeptidyl aminopeptidase/acylaminoacyl peptidase